MKILLTGFEPFGGESVNPAQKALTLVRDEIRGTRIVKCCLPVVFGKAIEIVHEVMVREKPDAVLCIGQAGGRTGVTVERVAINCDDARIPDNEGNQPADQPVFADGPSAYFSTLPIKKMVDYINREGVPAVVSNSAGTYVCNHLMYGVCYYIAREFPETIGGFMHVPFLPEQVADKKDVPSLTEQQIVRAIEASLEAIIDYMTKQ